MKYIYLFLLSMAMAMVIPSYAAEKTTVLEDAKNAAKQTVATNLNEVIVDILRGVKTAGGEMYQASKTAITKSIDFTMEQAPLVVKEFLAWKLTERIVWLSAFIIVSIFLLFISHKVKKRGEADDLPKSTPYGLDRGDCTAFKWVLRCVALLILIINLTTNGMTIAKILVAPRVYLIEYVVDTINGNNHSR